MSGKKILFGAACDGLPLFLMSGAYYKHKHNTNILIVGGSGAGKTRTYGVPNVLECASSMVITDPKSEILRKTGNLLKQKGYEVLVFDLINPAASFCYNPFVYVHDDREVLTLIENLIQNTTPSHSKSSDPFWEKSETALLQALMLYLLHEAPPEEQNFPMVSRRHRERNPQVCFGTAGQGNHLHDQL